MFRLVLRSVLANCQHLQQRPFLLSLGVFASFGFVYVYSLCRRCSFLLQSQQRVIVFRTSISVDWERAYAYPAARTPLNK